MCVRVSTKGKLLPPSLFITRQPGVDASQNIHTAMFQRMIDIEGKNINFDLQIARQGKMIADLTEELAKRGAPPPPPMTAFASSRSYRHINSLRFDPSKSNYKFIRKLGGTKCPRSPYPSNCMPSQRSASSPSTPCPNVEFSTPSADMSYSHTPHILETQFLVNQQQQPRKVSFSPRVPRSRSSRPRAHTTASARSQGYPDPGVQHTHRSISYHAPPQDSPIPQECLPLSPGHRSQSQPQQIYHYQHQNESIPQQPSLLAPSFEHLLYDNTTTMPSLLSQSPLASLSAVPHFEPSGGIPSTAICGSLLESQGYQTDQEIRYSNSSPVDGFVELFKRYEAEDNLQYPLMQPQQPAQPAPTVPESHTSGQLQYYEHETSVPFHESQLERQFHPPPQVVAEDQYQAPSSLSYHPQVLSQPVLASHDPNVLQQQEQHFSSSHRDRNTSYGTHYDQNDGSTLLCHIPEIPLPGTQIGVTSSTSKSWDFDGVPPFPLTPHLFAKSAQERSLSPYAPHRVKNASFPLPEGLWDDITDEPKSELKDFL